MKASEVELIERLIIYYMMMHEQPNDVHWIEPMIENVKEILKNEDSA